MRALASATVALLGVCVTNYAVCGPDGPENPSPFIVCSPPSVPADAATLLPVSLRSGCPADDAPLDLVVRELTTGELNVSVAPGVWVARARSDADHCVALELEVPFPDGSRRWIANSHPLVDRVPAADGFCVRVNSGIPVPSTPSLGATTVRVRVIGATFAGEAELPAVIGD